MNIFNIFKRSATKETPPISYSEYYPEVPCGLSFESIRKRMEGDPLKIPSFYSCLSLIKNTIASMPIEVSRVGRKGIINTLPKHPIIKAFTSGLISKYSLFSKIVEDVVLRGNAFCYIRRSPTGTVLSIKYLRDCSVIYNEATGELYYKSPTIGGTVEPINILHFYKDSINGVTGYPLLANCRRTIRIAEASDRQAENFFTSGCNVTGFLKSKTNLSEAQKKQLKDSWYSVNGPNTNGGIPVLPADIDFVQTSLNAVDAQLLETRKYNSIEICKLFNIPPVFIGEQGGATYSTPENEQQAFLNNCILPWVNMIECELNRKLILDGDNLQISLNEESLLRSDKKSQAEFFAKTVSGGILSINEAREELGYSDIGEEGDKHIIPFTNIQQNSIENENGKGDKISEDK